MKLPNADRVWDWLRERLQIGVLNERVVERLSARADRANDALIDRIRMATAAPAPFVCVLAEGFTSEGRPTMLGTAGRASERRFGATETLRLRSLVPLTDVRIVVFCDLEIVNVRAIHLGCDLLTIGIPGMCPTARTAEWPAGLELNVTVEPRSLR